MNSSELAPAFPAAFSLTAESLRTGDNWRPQEVQGFFFFPAAGRNQTLLKLVVLPSAEFTSTPDVPLKHRLRPIPEVLAADLPEQKALGKSSGK